MKLLLLQAKEIGINIKKILEQYNYIIFRSVIQNPNHEVIKLLLLHAEEVKVNIEEALGVYHYIIFCNAAQNPNHEVIKLLLEYSESAGVNLEAALKIRSYTSFYYAAKNSNHKVIEILFAYARKIGINIEAALQIADYGGKYALFRCAVQNENINVLDFLLKELEKTGEGQVEALLYDRPFIFLSKEKLMFALSYIKAGDKEYFAKCCSNILGHKVFEKIISDNVIKDSIMSSSYKISFLRYAVDGAIISQEGRIYDQWHKNSELTQLSMVKKDIMQHYKGNKLGILHKFSELNPNLKSYILSFLINQVNYSPALMSEILLVLRKPLHKILDAQKIANNVPLKERLALKEYQQDLELPISSYAQKLNELFFDEILSAAEVVYGIDFKVIDLPEIYQKQNAIALFREEEFIEQNIADAHTILETLHDMSIGFKELDVAINSIRFVREPTTSNARKVIIESAHLYTMFSGFNWYSNIVNIADIIYSGYLGEYNKVLQYALVTLAYMGLPYAAACFGASQIVLIYNIFVASYSAYSALSNLYSLYEEYLRDDWSLKSDAAYAELGWFLQSAFGYFSYDFFAKSNGNDEEMCLVARVAN